MQEKVFFICFFTFLLKLSKGNHLQKVDKEMWQSDRNQSTQFELNLHVQGVGVTVHSIMRFVSEFYTVGHVGRYEGGLSKLSQNCVTDI